MSELNFSQISERFWNLWEKFAKQVDEEGSASYSREKIVVFIIALILAMGLWFLVNLSRSYTLNVNLPIELGNIPDDRALAEDLPDFATASVQGEGWKLLNIYNNPPQIFVDVTSGEINLYNQVQEQMNTNPEIDVQKVQPLTLNIELEEEISRKVPVHSGVAVEFNAQYDFMNQPRLSPDSVTITGASTIVNSISAWRTDSVTIENVHDDISQSVALREPPRLLSLSTDVVEYSAEVAQFTEGETRVLVRALNLPEGQNITFSPSFITVRYSVPIEEYGEVVDRSPFTAVVPYSAIRLDSSGFVTPEIEVLADADQFHIKVDSHQPDKVAYFEVLNN